MLTMMTKHFWKTYLSDKDRFIILGGAGLLVTLLLSLFVGPSAIILFVGYTLMDPFSYYFITYRRHYPMGDPSQPLKDLLKEVIMHEDKQRWHPEKKS